MFFSLRKELPYNQLWWCYGKAPYLWHL